GRPAPVARARPVLAGAAIGGNGAGPAHLRRSHGPRPARPPAGRTGYGGLAARAGRHGWGAGSPTGGEAPGRSGGTGPDPRPVAGLACVRRPGPAPGPAGTGLAHRRRGDRALPRRTAGGAAARKPVA